MHSVKKKDDQNENKSSLVQNYNVTNLKILIIY